MYPDDDTQSRFRKKKRRKGFPKSLLLTIMEADTKKGGPKARCVRCGNTYVLKHMRYIRVQWLEHDYVCAMCYNSKKDMKV